MNDTPLALQQLIQMTAGELGLGPADRHTLGLALIRAYDLGAKNERSRHIASSTGRDNDPVV